MTRRVPLIVPELGLGSAAIRVTVWHARVGNQVRRGERLIELAAAAVVIDLPAPESGVLEQQLAAEEDAVTVGQTLGWIQPPDDPLTLRAQPGGD
jgi:pyruvate/2-oxoglutarate dehydrogenase complex dihydrolipoamide acyltransferase (E2) component